MKGDFSKGIPIIIPRETPGKIPLLKQKFILLKKRDFLDTCIKTITKSRLVPYPYRFPSDCR